MIQYSNIRPFFGEGGESVHLGFHKESIEKQKENVVNRKLRVLVTEIN